MQILAQILIGIIAALHLYIAWFEMFAWESRGPKVFTTFPKEMFAKTKAMAANQGIYNAFLAAGLFWSLLIGDPAWAMRVAVCFLLFVAVAGLVGAMTVTKRIAFVQTVPAVIALTFVFLA